MLNQPEGRESLKNLAPGGSAEKDTATEGLLRERHAYGKDVRALSQGLDASEERISLWPDPETDHTLKYQRTIDKEALIQIRTLLEKILKEKNPAPSMVYSAMGHSHLDLLFLWPERETRRKCARTLSTVVKMMDRFPEYRFCLSQAPVYLWMKEEYPSLYKRLRELIEEKRIEVTGAFWVECDTNLPCGESLVRQLLYGKRFFREEFGLDMKVGFLPDVFGYSAALPQLFAKSGVPYFTTNKLSMNDTNRFPRYTFWWHGLDGSRVLTHMLPENSYTSAAVPQMAIYGEYHHTDKDVSPEGLQHYRLYRRRRGVKLGRGVNAIFQRAVLFCARAGTGRARNTLFVRAQVQGKGFYGSYGTYRHCAVYRQSLRRRCVAHRHALAHGRVFGRTDCRNSGGRRSRA